MLKVTKTTVRRCKRTDDTLNLVQQCTGELTTPGEWNVAYANVLRLMADKIETIRNAYVDPELVIWMQARKNQIEAEVTLSPAK